MDTRLTKILEQIRTKGWTAEEKLWMAGCMMCQVFLEQIHGVSEGHIQCLFFAITEVICILVRENDEQNCAFLNWLIRYDTVFEFSVPWHDSILWSWIIIQVPGVGGGGYSIYPWVGRCGAAPHTLTLFKTNIADFSTLFKTEFRFLIPCLRHLSCLRQKLMNRYPDQDKKW